MSILVNTILVELVRNGKTTANEGIVDFALRSLPELPLFTAVLFKLLGRQAQTVGKVLASACVCLILASCLGAVCQLITNRLTKGQEHNSYDGEGSHFKNLSRN